MSYSGRRRDIPRPLRRAILATPCHACGGTRGPTVHVDHLTPWAERVRAGLDPDTPDNLAGICAACHTDKTREDIARGIARRARTRTPEPHPGIIRPS